MCSSIVIDSQWLFFGHYMFNSVRAYRYTKQPGDIYMDPILKKWTSVIRLKADLYFYIKVTLYLFPNVTMSHSNMDCEKCDW